MNKILVTCPPMLRQLDRFSQAFSDFNFEVTAPDVVQTLSVDELIEIVPKHDGWIIGDDPATAEVFEAGRRGRLKAAVKWGIGVDNVDFSACERLGIPVTNTPLMFGKEVADLAMCYLIGLSRDAFQIDREIRDGKWPKPCGVSVSGKNLGIVGLGDIGRNIARRASAHDLNILAWDPYAKSVPEYIELCGQFPEGIQRCDFVIFACALTSETHHLFNNTILDACKPGLRVINVSRGPLIDEKSLIKGLKTGAIASAALDVFENEPLPMNSDLLQYPQCIFGSHNGSNTIEAVQRASLEALRLLSTSLAYHEEELTP